MHFNSSASSEWRNTRDMRGDGRRQHPLVQLPPHHHLLIISLIPRKNEDTPGMVIELKYNV